MIRIVSTIYFILLGFALFGQTIMDLEADLSKAASSKEKVDIHLQLAKAYRGNDWDKAADHAFQAYNLSNRIVDKKLMAEASMLEADLLLRGGNNEKAESSFKRTLIHAKQLNNTGLALECFDQLTGISKKENNYKKAFNYAQQAVDMLSKGITNSSFIPSSKSKPQPASQNSGNTIKVDIDKLKAAKAKLEKDIANLNEDKRKLMEDKEMLDILRAEFANKEEEVNRTLSQQNSALDSLSAAKDIAAKMSRKEKQKLLRDIQSKSKESEALKRIADEIQLESDERAEKDRYLQYLLISLSGFILLLTFLFYGRYRSKKKAAKKLEQNNKIIDEARQRSDELLLNILPAAIADELKTKGKAKARRYNQATVMFTDFKNFSGITERMPPETLVSELDKCFKSFDFIISQYKIEKIKTIGDSYMCASGLSDKASAVNMIQAALDIQEFLEDIKKEKKSRGLPYFEARIGIHTGPVVAGVVGINKFAYDIWGDTVNIASRMESKGEVGKVNISADTYKHVKNTYKCIPRGKLNVKNKGLVEMYFVDGLL